MKKKKSLPSIYYKDVLIPCTTSTSIAKHKEIEALEFFILHETSDILRRIAGIRINQLSEQIAIAYEYH